MEAAFEARRSEIFEALNRVAGLVQVVCADLVYGSLREYDRRNNWLAAQAFLCNAGYPVFRVA
jgi:hypothetical protein